jgi:hypothetical protein
MEPSEKLRVLFDLFDAGEDMMRQTLRRRFPAATAAEIEERVVAWLASRPGAEAGDAPGRTASWPHRRRG